MELVNLKNIANSEKTLLLAQASADLIKEVQFQLSALNLYDGAVDGIVGRKTMSAFNRFKELEYLQKPGVLGKTTAIALLDATNNHPIPNDFDKKNKTIELSKDSKYLPIVGWVGSKSPIYPNSNFTWGEFTKDLTRVPENTLVTDNIIKLAKHLDAARSILGDRAMTITSGYRPPAVNRAVGGVSNSRHVFGDAADIVVRGMSPREVYRKLNSWHGAKGGLGDSTSFTHVDLRGYRARWNYGNA